MLFYIAHLLVHVSYMGYHAHLQAQMMNYIIKHSKKSSF